MSIRHKPSRRDPRCPGAVKQEHRCPVLAWNDQSQKERVDVKSRIVQRSQRIALRPDGAHVAGRQVETMPPPKSKATKSTSAHCQAAQCTSARRAHPIATAAMPRPTINAARWSCAEGSA